MDLVVTHTNADFDALSSLVAAGKLYPKARLLLPGSQEKAVRKFFSLIKDTTKIEDEKTCRMDDITRLVIVDNRHRSRIGRVADILEKKGLKIHIYDHHQRTSSDIKASKDVFREVGSTVSILLDILAKKGKLSLTPLEGTLMLLGIYEETGSLSYSSTTKLDVDMVGRLLEQGANLGAVSSYLNRELSENELSALIELLGSIEVVSINGIDIAFAGMDTTHFDGETGTLVHKLQDVENFPVLFAMFRAKEKTKIMARSRMDLINVHQLLGHFNGSGHPSAASARVEKKSFEEIKCALMRLLEAVTRPEVYAEDIMSFPVRTVSQEEKVRDVLAQLKRFGCKGAPVIDEGTELVGMITLGDIKKALKHGMGHSRIKGYMSTPLVTVAPKTALHVLKAIMTKKDKGRIPVVKGDKIIGIVTRTDVLKKVHGSLFARKSEKQERATNITAKMTKALPKKLLKIIRSIGAEGDASEVKVFLIGGFVRDLLLKEKNYDLDIAVEGDAIRFGRRLAEKMGGTLVVHRKFGTATLVKEWPEGLGPSLHPGNKFKIDIATARKEVYERPAALPKVEFSSLREDLYRRDFTINAMAVNINKKEFGLFIDFFGGKKDLENGCIRILHDKSFMDDPTRIFRAVRFEQRFGFTIEKHTEYLITHAVRQEMFRRTENQRIRDELILMLKEERPEKAVFRMDELHELHFIHPGLVLKRSQRTVFSDLKKHIKWYESLVSGKKKLDTWLMNFIMLTDKLTAEQVEEVLEKFVFTRKEKTRLRSYKEKASKLIRKLSYADRLAPSEIYDLLEGLSHEVILCIMTKTVSVRARRRIKEFLGKYSGVKLRIGGGDLKRAGIPPGPRYRKILREILREKLDKKLSQKKDEVKLVRELVLNEKKKRKK